MFGLFEILGSGIAYEMGFLIKQTFFHGISSAALCRGGVMNLYGDIYELTTYL